MRPTVNTTRIPALRLFVHAGLALALGAAACAKGPPLVNPGASHAAAANVSLSHPAPDASPVWELVGELGGYRKLAKAPFASQGHFDGRWTAEVLANDLAAPEYVKLPTAGAFPKGSVMVETHAERAGGAAGPIFAMVKRDPGYYPEGGDWEYVVALSDGRLQDRGQLTLCARCHAEAPSGWLFGLARASR